MERLQGTWQKGLLAQARTASLDLANKLDEHDAAQKRYLGHKCVSQPPVLSTACPESSQPFLML